MFTFCKQQTFHRGVEYFNEVKEVNRIICPSFCLVKALLVAYKMKARSVPTRNLKSITSTIHSFPACLPFLSFAYVTQLKAVKRANDFLKKIT